MYQICLLYTSDLRLEALKKAFPGVKVIELVSGNIFTALKKAEININHLYAGKMCIRDRPSVEYNIKKDRSIGHSLDRAATVISKMIVTVKSGTAASLTLGKTDNDVRAPYAQGKTTITENRVTVAADATSTDSINSPCLLYTSRCV